MSTFFGVTVIACQNRFYLSEEERLWNPYNVDQMLIFQSTGDRYDTLEITGIIGSSFPDGIGARHNERLRVIATHRIEGEKGKQELSFLYIYAPWKEDPSAINFEFFLPGRSFWGRGYPIQELEKYKKIAVETRYGTFEDVITIQDNSGRPVKKQDIKVIFWSRSKGYVGFEQYDGTKGELVDVIKRPG